MSALERPIEDFCETGAGGTPSRSVADYFGGEMPWVKSGELHDDLLTQAEERVTREGIAAARLKVVPAGSLLVAMYGATVGRTALLGIDATTNQAVCNIRPDPRRADTRYVWFALRAKLPEFLSRRFGGAQPNISQETIRRTRIHLPALAEQRRIANILDKADAIRRKRKEAIALTEELLRSAFLEMFGDPVTNPKGWPIGRFSDVLAQPLRNGLSPASGGSFAASVLTLSAITRGRFDGSAVKPGMFASEPWEDVRVDARDFLVCRGNGNVAMVGAGRFPATSDSSVVFPDTMIGARVDPTKIARAFLEQLWQEPVVRRQIERAARTTNGTFKINQRALEAVEVLVPPIALQRQFELMRAKTSQLREKYEDPGWNNLFNSLVDRAFRGELTPSRPAAKGQLGLPLGQEG